MPKLYTRKGDDGTTQGGIQRVSKASPVSNLLGLIDQVHAELGWLWMYIHREPQQEQLVLERLIELLVRTCMDISTKIHRHFHQDPATAPFGDSVKVKILEGWIAFWADQTPSLKEFIITPGMVPAALKANDLRVLTRTVERNWIACGGTSKDPDSHFWNRLSSFFFALSRYLQSQARHSERVRSDLKDLKWPEAPQCN